MAEIKIEELQNYVDGLKDWLSEGHSPAKECLVLKFKKGHGESVIDEEMVNETLYLQSRNGNITIEFDSSGLMTSIELS